MFFGVAQQRVEGREGAGGQDVAGLWRERLDARVEDGGRKIGSLDDGSKEGGLSLIALDKAEVRGGGFLDGNGREDEGRKAGA